MFLVCEGVALAAGVTMMTIEELKALQDSKPIILDVRPTMSWAFSGSKIRGAVREDPSSVESWQQKYPRDSQIILYCQTDVTSSGVARKLASAGFQKIYVLKGGWSAWSDAHYPTEKK
jgi:rhodanese-related sulfurtransferase